MRYCRRQASTAVVGGREPYSVQCFPYCGNLKCDNWMALNGKRIWMFRSMWSMMMIRSYETFNMLLQHQQYWFLLSDVPENNTRTESSNRSIDVDICGFCDMSYSTAASMPSHKNGFLYFKRYCKDIPSLWSTCFLMPEEGSQNVGHSVARLSDFEATIWECC